LAAAHWAWVVITQLREPGEIARQHAPVCGGVQEWFAQFVFAVKTPFWAEHWAWVRLWQEVTPVAGSVMQQAPVMLPMVQVLVVHTEPGPWKTPFRAAHSAWVRRAQVMTPPEGKQQAPVVGLVLEQVKVPQGTPSPR
jgi:hypothetical protein